MRQIFIEFHLVLESGISYKKMQGLVETRLVRNQEKKRAHQIFEAGENISHLKNLKWLDLSFNVIKEIEGVDSLINLEDLSLYNN